MNLPQRIPGFDDLSPAEKVIYIQDLWDRLAARQEDVEVTEAQRHELDRRLQSHVARPDDGLDWETARKSLEKER